ncbi:MAG TPA: MGMT family protein [Solirubrobacteraceae bacterium]|nr:MGMT family protein [Solirubrobacteraceae bacterium]
MDTDKLRAVLETVPAGRWTSYADVVAALGAAPAAARRVNQAITKHELPNGHRVLKGDGSVAPTALGDPAAAHARLVEEGVPFDDLGRASQEARFRPEAVVGEAAAT